MNQLKRAKIEPTTAYICRTCATEKSIEIGPCWEALGRCDVCGRERVLYKVAKPAVTRKELTDEIIRQWDWYLESEHYARFEAAVMHVLDFVFERKGSL